MVKEPELLYQRDVAKFLIEVGADDKSRLAILSIHEGKAMHCEHLLDPKSGTWYSDHVSTASPPISVHKGSKIILVNGRDEDTWRIGFAHLRGEEIEMREPFLSPPENMSPGPGGQRIAFASFYDEVSQQLYYHLQDRCLARCNLTIG